MFKKIIIPLALASSTVLADTGTGAAGQDPLQIILNKLDSMDQRIQKLENSNSPTPTATPVQAQATAPTATQAPAATATTASAATTNAQDEMLEGMIVKIKRGDSKSDDWMLNSVNAPHFAGYVSDSAIIKTTDIYDKSIGYKGAYAIQTEGYIKAEEPGVYSFGMLHRLINDLSSFAGETMCLASISINGSEIANTSQELEKYNKNEINMLVAGDVELEPGLYEYSAFSVCNDHDTNGDHSVERSFMIRTPTDLSMRNMEKREIFHKK